jgi:cellobiose phosphorylase
MKFGYFDDLNREYVITQPDTPLPWINYLGCQAYFGIISNTAGGYSFYRDARLRRISRYRYNNVPLDYGGRYVYLRDDESKEFWSPSWQPTRHELKDYSCRHGMGYSVIGSSYSGIEAHTRYFVPLDENLEIWQLTVTNRRTTRATISAFANIEFCLWDAQDDATRRSIASAATTSRTLPARNRAPDSTRSGRRFWAAIAAGTSPRPWRPVN